jgi:hypothetical protein
MGPQGAPGLSLGHYGPADASLQPWVFSHLLEVPFVAPTAGTAVVYFAGTCCLETKALADGCTEKTTALWVNIDPALAFTTEKTTVEMPNFPGTSQKYCLPTVASRAFAVPAGDNRLWVNAKTTNVGYCIGQATVFFTPQTLGVPAQP